MARPVDGRFPIACDGATQPDVEDGVVEGGWTHEPAGGAGAGAGWAHGLDPGGGVEAGCTDGLGAAGPSAFVSIGDPSFVGSEG